MQCSLITVDLDDNPDFDALSYTWGDPVTVHERPEELKVDPSEIHRQLRPGESVHFDIDAWQYHNQHPFIPFEKVDLNVKREHAILCNGQSLMVTENVIFLLQMLRRWRFDDRSCAEDFETLTGHPLCRYIWMDMVCINQDDADEKNAQIRIMGRIFQSAQIVVGWLGPEANQSRCAGAALGRFFHALVDDTSILRPNVVALYSVKGISEKDVYAIFALFQRLWFRRAWIVQEAVLARKLVLSCGGILVQWGVIDLLVQILQSHNLYNSLVEFGTALMKGGPSNKASKDTLKAGGRVFGYRPEQKDWAGHLQVNPLAFRDFVTGVGSLRGLFDRKLFYIPSVNRQEDIPEPSSAGIDNQGAGIDNQGPEYEDRPSTPIDPIAESLVDTPIAWYENLLYLFRSSSASDPRDKIFSLYGLMERSGLQLLDIPWDYRETVQEVYTNTVRSIIKATKRIDILSHVQDPSRTNVTGLPSWVPDFSADLRAVLLNNPIKPVFSASGLQNIYEARSTLTGCLRVEGFMIDNIICVAPARGCYFVRTAMVVSGLPLRYHPGRSSPEDAQTRAEAYWRTLLADTIQDTHPAPLEYGFDFSDWIVEEVLRARGARDTIRQGEHATAKTHNQSRTLGFPDRAEKKEFWWAVLDQGETGEFIPIEKLEEMLKDEKPGVRSYPVNAEAGALPAAVNKSIRFIPDAKRLNSCTTIKQVSDTTNKSRVSTTYHRTERMPTFKARLADVKRGHRMFRTTNHYLGLGPISSSLGDEVWILKGARTPFVLRRRKDGRHQVIGECYVHGIMHGEAVQGSFKPTSLDLV
jgi:hypothetical protein